MEKYWDAGAGLKKMFIASIGVVVCLVLVLVPGINLLAALAALAFAILSMVGLYQAGKDIESCKTAFMLTIAKIVVNVIGNVTQNAMISLIIALAGYVLDALVVYLVCTSVSDIIERMGENSIANKGRLIWKLYLGGFIVTVVLSLLMVIPSLSGITVVINIAVTLLSVAVMVLYTIFLYQSSNILQ